MLTNPVARIRNSLQQLRVLANSGDLTADRLSDLTRRCERDLDQAAREASLGLEPEEHFEITLEGLQALYVNGKKVRWRGHLAVVDGDRP